MVKKNLGIIFLILSIMLVIAGCASVTSQLSPNSSQSVINVKRASSGINKKKVMEVYIDGRKEDQAVKNGMQGQVLVMNGIHNIQVKLGKYESQMLTFECQSEVVEFYANFEGEKKMFGDTRQLSLLKTSGGTGGSNAAATNAGPAPVFNITVDNSSSNTSTSSGNTSTSSNTTTTIDDSVVGD